MRKNIPFSFMLSPAGIVWIWCTFSDLRLSFERMRRRFLVLAGSFFLFGSTVISQPGNIEGDWNNGIWNNNNTLSDRGNVKAIRLQASVSANRNFLFNLTSASYTTQWTGSNAPNYYRALNSRLSGAAFYFTGGAWNTNLQFSAVDANYYTFIIGKNAAANNDLAIWETPFNPRDISAVSAAPGVVSPGQSVPVTITLSGDYQGSGATLERAWVRYTTDNWTNSSMVEVGALNGSYQGVATIPAPANTAGTTVKYYVLTTGNNTFPTHTDADYQSLNFRNATGQNSNSGVNFSYTVATGWTSASDGNWSSASTWTANAVPPLSGSMGLVNIGHKVSLDQNATLTSLNINADTLTASGTNTLTVSGTATVANAAVFYNSSNTASNISISSFVVSNGGSYFHNTVSSAANGITNDFPGYTSRLYGASSNVTIKKWANGGTAPVALPVSGNPGWGNLTIDVASLGGNWVQSANLVTRIQGNFTVSATGAYYFGLLNNTSGFLRVSGNTYLSGGSFLILSNGSGKAADIFLDGDLTLTNNAKFQITTGSFNIISTSEIDIILKGDLTISDAAQILQPTSLGLVTVIAFSKASGTQYFTSHSTGINQSFIGWGVGDITKAGGCTNTLQLNTDFIARDNSVFRIYNNATLRCPNETYVSGAGAGFVLDGEPVGFTLYSGGKIEIGSEDGITTAGNAVGNIRSSGARNFNTAAHYIYNGAYNQVTGNGLPGTITGSLTIANTGTNPGDIVALTTNNTTATTVNFSSGRFQAGNNKTLRIASGGTLNGNGYNSYTGHQYIEDDTGGTIEFVGSGTVNGTPELYNVTINGAVNFVNNARINHYLTINTNGYASSNAPKYAVGSTLIYNILNANYNRSIEWGATVALAAGYPHHVLVQNGTYLNLGTAIPPRLAIGGNLTIGTATSGSNNVNMNALALPLEIYGNLVIGDAATTLNRLTMSTAIGGDLELHGNFTRYRKDNYYDNEAYNGNRGRMTTFKGSSNATINVLSVSGADMLQRYHILKVDKAGSGDVTLNIPVEVENELNLTMSGNINTTSAYLLTVTATNASSVQGGSTLSFVNGPLQRYTSTSTAGAYVFPIGKTSPLSRYKPATVTTINNLASGGVFKGEYYYAEPPTPGGDIYDNNLVAVNNVEYWQMDRPVGTTTAKLTLPYTDPGGSNWRDVDALPLSPCGGCEIAVIKRSPTINPFQALWAFTATSPFATGTPPESRLYSADGDVISGEIASFSPFTFGIYYEVILPVKLLGFTGKLANADGSLSWQVADTRDLKEFELQYSRDGKNFEKLDLINAATGTNYGYVHKRLTGGNHFYRLQVKQKDGKSFYSHIVLLTVGKPRTQIVGLKNNPVHNQLTMLIVSASKQPAQATITDAAGRVYNQLQTGLLPGSNQWPVSVQLLAKGVYFMQVRTADGETGTLRFVKE